MKNKENEQTISCVECNKSFKDDDVVNECNACGEIVCDKDKCLKEHQKECADVGFDTHTNEICVECGNVEEEMGSCGDCQEIVCSDCEKEHIINHHLDSVTFEEYNAEDYIKEKVADEL